MITDKFVEHLLSACLKVPERKLESVFLKNNLLNVNKSQKSIDELKKMAVNVIL